MYGFITRYLCNFHFMMYFFPAELDQEKETTNSNNTIQFAVLMRKGPKQTLKELAVPKDSDMAQNLLKQEEAQRLEKEKMKKLTLEINERQEEEDLNEAIAMVCYYVLFSFFVKSFSRKVFCEIDTFYLKYFRCKGQDL